MRCQPSKAALIAFLVPSVSAEFDSFYWAGNGGNSSVLKTCKGSPYNCEPPAICAVETLTLKIYCCTTGSSDAECWIGSPTCGADATTHQPSAGQQGCAGANGASTVNYCCLAKEEECIPTSGSFNVCWSTAQNVVASLNVSRINQTYSSLSSASPSATAYTIASPVLVQLSSTSSTTVNPSATSTVPATSSSAASHSNGLSGGAIGGIVGGILGGLLLIAIAAFLYLRRIKRSHIAQEEMQQQQYAHQQYPQNYVPNANDYQPAPQMTPAELSYGQPQMQKHAQGEYGTSEMPRNERPVELEGRYQQQGWS